MGATLHIFFGLLAPLELIVKILTNNRRNVNCEGINSGLYQKFYSGHLNPTPYAYIRQRDGVDDRTKAATLLYESLAISSELGMRPLMERVQTRRETLRA